MLDRVCLLAVPREGLEPWQVEKVEQMLAEVCNAAARYVEFRLGIEHGLVVDVVVETERRAVDRVGLRAWAGC